MYRMDDIQKNILKEPRLLAAPGLLGKETEAAFPFSLKKHFHTIYTSWQTYLE